LRRKLRRFEEGGEEMLTGWSWMGLGETMLLLLLLVGTAAVPNHHW